MEFATEHLSESLHDLLSLPSGDLIPLTVEKITALKPLLVDHSYARSGEPAFVYWHPNLPILMTLHPVRLWSATGRLIQHFTSHGQGFWSADGSWFVLKEKLTSPHPSISVYHLPLKRIDHLALSESLKISPNPSFPLVAVMDKQHINCWHVLRAKVDPFERVEHPTTSLCQWSPDGEHFLMLAPRRFPMETRVNIEMMTLWNRDGAVMRSQQVALKSTRFPRWSPTSQQFITQSAGFIRWWSNLGNLLYQLPISIQITMMNNGPCAGVRMVNISLYQGRQRSYCLRRMGNWQEYSNPTPRCPL
jgi:hypothetical protein